MKIRPFWAVLITGVVLIQNVSPVLADQWHQQYPTHLMKDGYFSRRYVYPNIDGMEGLRNDPGDNIQPVSFDEFKTSVTVAGVNRITGLYVPNFGGFPVVQPPAGGDGSVSSSEGEVTQFMRPAENNVIGLLAHNYLSGAWFEKFPDEGLVYVIFGDGKSETYRIKEWFRFEALENDSTTSDFVDTASGLRYSVLEVYEKMYGGKPHLTFQTCTQKHGDLSWGRLFLLAEPFLE